MSKIFSDEIRIPTLLGLGVLISGLAVGVYLVMGTKTFFSRAAPTVEPKDITVANISDTSASIFWQTGQEALGFVQAGPTPGLGQTFLDERDSVKPVNHHLHLVTLTNLKPETTYYFKVTSPPLSYPQNSPLSFKTAPQLPNLGEQPLIGKVVSSELEPTEEALVILEIPGAQKLAAITKTAGNFILPLAGLKTATLSESFSLSVQPSAKLTVLGPAGTSRVNLKLPPGEALLPPIVLGKDVELASASAGATPSSLKYDLNGDGTVNSLDYSIVVDNLGKKPKVKGADLNGDGVVDKKDVGLINKVVSGTSSPKQ